MDPWNPDQYAKFLREREQPFVDLVSLIRAQPGMHIVDLGCGTGRLTRRLHDQLQAAATLGLDRSPRMLAEANRDCATGGLRFDERDIAAFPADGERFDLVFSNAALHWVDDHARLFARLASALTPHGQIAVQMPAMHGDPSQVTAMEVAEIEPFRAALDGWRRSQPVLLPEQYAQLLFRLGFRQPAVRLIVYPHVLGSAEEVVEWVKGTLLAEYSRHLPADLFVAFVDEYRRRLLQRLDQTRPFLFPFKRILIWAQSVDSIC
jgi:trans-aconitate 2-methyltransferase